MSTWIGMTHLLARAPSTIWRPECGTINGLQIFVTTSRTVHVVQMYVLIKIEKFDEILVEDISSKNL